MPERKTIEIGQVYRDKDKRELSGNRRLRVVKIDGDKVFCESYPNGGFRTKIRADRLTSWRFELIQDATDV